MFSDSENFSLNIEGYKFVLICHCNPEQYDVYKLDKFDSTNPIGYVRLRFGNLTASCGKERIFYKKFDNEWKGEFSSDGERVIYLREIADAIDKSLDNSQISVILISQTKTNNNQKNKNKQQT